MKKYVSFAICIAVGAMIGVAQIIGCAAEPSGGVSQPIGAVPVKVVKTQNGYQLLRGGKPYFVKGAGGGESWSLLSQYGGNSVRTWGADTLGKDLENAQSNGLTLTAGIWLGHKEHGFNYSDPNAVRNQFDSAQSTVERYKNSPNLLIWALGNEMEGYGPTTDPNMWKAVEDLARMAHRVDPNHPTMTVIAELGGNKISSINKYCPDIDIIGINSYAGAQSIAQRYQAAGGIKPFIVTEYGPPGVWEMKMNSWGAAPEPTSTQKADWYVKAYTSSIANQPLCVGSYVFAWGYKQEATATWYGMFLPDGSRLAPVDAMSKVWTGKTPQRPVPVINSLTLAGPDSVSGGAAVEADAAVQSPTGDPLKIDWKLVSDPASYHVGGDVEATPQEYPDAIASPTGSHVKVVMPKYKGAYRLFAYVHDQHGGAAVGNIPILIAQGDVAGPVLAKKATLPLVLYGDNVVDAPYIASGWMGNAGAIKMDPQCASNPHDGKTCIQVDYTAGDSWGRSSVAKSRQRLGRCSRRIRSSRSEKAYVLGARRPGRRKSVVFVWFNQGRQDLSRHRLGKTGCSADVVMEAVFY